jgi:hypothetical protein
VSGEVDEHDAREKRFGAVQAHFARHFPRLRLRLNRNRRLLVSLNQQRSGSILSAHERLLDHPEALADLFLWVRQGGRGRYPALRAAMRAIVDVQRRQEEARLPSLSPVPLLGGPLDLGAVLTRIHAAWFPHVPKPSISWSRNGRSQSRQRHIRFGCYWRRPTPRITLHPRLDQPWVAVCFVEHVVFHELCHHAQACTPIRGEAIHSRRFREWERRYPQHDLALAWERAHLQHFLDGTAPCLAASSAVSA